MARLALLATAVSLTLDATPVLAQTFSDYNGNDTVATREQGNTAAVGQVGNPNYRAWNNGPPDYRTAVRCCDGACCDGDGQRLGAVWPVVRPLS
jgi:hypothetical protein